jgi:Kef-type K+ transport system membrane component KefB
MTLSSSDVAHMLAAFAVLLIAAHGVGSTFARLRQPRVIGEIVGGLILGPTVLGAAAPAVHDWLFPSGGTTATVLGATYQIGLLILMYCSGMEIRSVFRRREARAATSILLLGTVVPFGAGAFALKFFDESRFFGPAGNGKSFLLVFAIAVAVTSIPVISRIMFDLGLLGTPFSRIVLGVAVVEDIVLYVVLAVALGMSGKSQSTPFGLPQLLRLPPGSIWDVVYHSSATVGVLAICLLVGRPVYQATAEIRFNLIRRWSPVAFQLLFMLTACIVTILVGIQPFFGALAAGIVVGASSREPNPIEEGATVAIKEFGLAFFIPIYFAIVGLQLDLIHNFSVLFFLAYLLFACAVKTASVYAGARVGGQRPTSAVNLAVAMNARGGPGIVLATVAYGAQLINQSFYAVLVLLAIVTSLLAGTWLDRVPKDHLLAKTETQPGGGAISALHGSSRSATIRGGGNEP